MYVDYMKMALNTCNDIVICHINSTNVLLMYAYVNVYHRMC